MRKQRPAGHEPHQAWVTGGIAFPDGTRFRIRHKGRFSFGRVEDGELVLDGQRFTSLSSAATHISGNSLNGWKVWYCKRPDDERYISVNTLRANNLPAS